MFQGIKRALSSVVGNLLPPSGYLGLFPDAASNKWYTVDDAGSKTILGDGVSSITLLGTAGRVKTYRITRESGATFDYTVTDGQDGGILNFNGRVGTILPQESDYDQYYLTPAEGDAAYQPLDSDLTALAAIATTPFGRAQLAYSDSAAATAALNASTITLKGLQAAADKARQENNAKFEVNLLDFGADPTGATSSATALTNAINALPAAGGVVHIPAGTYNLGNTPYTISKAHVTLRGAARYNTTITSTATDQDIIRTAEYYINIEELTFAGPATGGNVENSSATAGFAVNAQSGAYTMVRRCAVRTVFNGIRLGNILSCADDVEVRYFKGSGIVVDHQSDHQINLAIMDNNTSFLPSGGGIQVLQAASLLLSNCNVIHANFALDIAPGAGITIPSIKAVNCFFDTSAVGLNMTSAGSFFRSEFTNCWFSSMSTAGIRLAPVNAGAIDGITFVNCDIYNNVGGTTTGMIASGNCSKWKMMGCTIAGWTTGVSLAPGATHFPTILGNTIGAVSAFGANGTGITISAGAFKGLVITDNDVVDNTAACNFGSITTSAGNLSIRENSGINPLDVALIADTAFTNTAATVATVNIPANSLIPGRTFEFEVAGSVINITAASNLVVDVLLNGVAIATATLALGTTAFAAPGRGFFYSGAITFRSVGAAGAAIAAGTLAVNAVAPVASNAAATTAVNTTAPITVAIRVASSAATSTGTIRQAAAYVGA